MSIYIIAQFIGFVGYLFYIGAPYFKTKTRIIQMDVIACIIISLQWYLLDQPSLLAFNVLIIVASIMALKAEDDLKIRKFLPLLYTIGCMAIIFNSGDNLVYILSLIAFCCTVASKFSRDIVPLRVHASISGTAFVIAGIMAFSIPAVIFNALFVGAHIFKLYQKYYLPRPQLLVKSRC